mgnify:CR=1 FL=1
MRNRFHFRPITLTATLALAGASVAACSSTSDGNDPSGAADIVATTNVWADVASAVTGKDVEAIISGDAVDPHHFEPSAKDLARIRDAGARLNDRGGAQLTGLAYVDGEIVGLCEVVRYASDNPKVCELGLVYVLPGHRGRGIGSNMLRASLEQAMHVWEDVETVYCSYPADAPAAKAVMRALDAEVVSATTAWQKY